MGGGAVNLDPLSFTIGNLGDSGPIRDVVSYLIGRVAGNVEDLWHTITDVEVATFTAVSLPLRKLVIDITPQQAGSGNPSPENVRPISGWSAVTISQSGADTSDPVTVEIDLGQTVYGGTLDVTTGLLTIAKAAVDLSQITWEPRSVYGVTSGDLKNVIAFPPDNNTVVNGIAEQYEMASFGRIYDQGVGKNLLGCTATGNLACSAIGTPSGQFVYPLASPQIVQLSATTIMTLVGVNNVWADTGNINTITFRIR